MGKRWAALSRTECPILSKRSIIGRKTLIKSEIPVRFNTEN